MFQENRSFKVLCWCLSQPFLRHADLKSQRIHELLAGLDLDSEERIQVDNFHFETTERSYELNQMPMHSSSFESTPPVVESKSQILFSFATFESQYPKGQKIEENAQIFKRWQRTLKNEDENLKQLLNKINLKRKEKRLKICWIPTTWNWPEKPSIDANVIEQTRIQKSAHKPSIIYHLLGQMRIYRLLSFLFWHFPTWISHIRSNMPRRSYHLKYNFITLASSRIYFSQRTLNPRRHLHPFSALESRQYVFVTVWSECQTAKTSPFYIIKRTSLTSAPFHVFGLHSF